jgi:5-histidylcysteine sulfoxide synthase
MLKSLNTPRLDNCTVPEILAYFQNSWQLEDTLFKSISADSTFYLNPDPLRNRLIFYLGHSAVFYINKLLQVGLLDRGINSYYENLFEIGVDPETPAEMSTLLAPITWPDLGKVWQYRQDAYQLITQIILHTPLNLPIHPQHPLWALLMATEHQRIHLETSSMLLRQLPSHLLQRPQGWEYAPSLGVIPRNPLLEVTGGKITLGKPESFPCFGWDSEYGSLEVEVKPFLASRYMISNGEFQQFLEVGGYENPQFWSKEAWEWREANQVRQPKFWRGEGDNYRYRTVFEEIALPLDWPVEVNYYEAEAYCRWQGKGFRLLREAEWYLASRLSPWEVGEFNLNLRYGSPTAGGYLSQNSQGLADLRGNIWEWLEQDFYPLPGFVPHYLYLDNAAPFFDGAHKMMLGGAWITTGTGMLGYYRNWFRPYFYQHAGFRLAREI